MDKLEMEAYLTELDEELACAFPSPEPIRVLVVGGACLLLSEVTERPTRDIDVIIIEQQPGKRLPVSCVPPVLREHLRLWREERWLDRKTK